MLKDNNNDNDTNKFTVPISQLISTTQISSSYCPLVIRGNDWLLSFQSKPECKIIFTGNYVPDTEELINCFKYSIGSVVPIILLEIVRIVIADQLTRQET